MAVEFKDNSKAVKAAMKQAKKKALTAIGQAAVEVTVDYMQNTSRYGAGSKGAGIYDTGDLQRDVNFRVRLADEMVDIGNSLDYAISVHNGTAKRAGKPYLFDAGTENGDIWREVSEEYISDEMK